MTISDNLDLSRLPPISLVDVEYEPLLADHIASLKARLAAAGIDWDVDGLETDPLVIQAQETTFRRLLDRRALNDAARSVMVAFSIGGDLEHLAALYGLARRVIDVGNPNATPPIAPTYESDDELRQRILMAPEALSSAGPAGAYVHHALAASAEIVSVRTIVPLPGQVQVILIGRGDSGIPSEVAINAVRARLLHPAIKPLTVDVTVSAASPLTYRVHIVLMIVAGPDRALIEQEAARRLKVLTDERRRNGLGVSLSSLLAAAHVSGVDRAIITSLSGDVVISATQVAVCEEILVTTEVLSA